jgi:hypothetical protein
MSDGARCHYCQKMPCQCPEFDVEATAPAPTPLERLEAWAGLSRYRDRREYTINASWAYLLYTAERNYEAILWWGDDCEYEAKSSAPTLDAAILAALAQAEGVR